jgi:hypothetical protein
LLAGITFALIVLVDFHVMAIAYPFIGLALASLALLDMNRQNTNNNDTNE